MQQFKSEELKLNILLIFFGLAFIIVYIYPYSEFVLFISLLPCLFFTNVKRFIRDSPLIFLFISILWNEHIYLNMSHSDFSAVLPILILPPVTWTIYIIKGNIDITHKWDIRQFFYYIMNNPILMIPLGVMIIISFKVFYFYKFNFYSYFWLFNIILFNSL